MNKVCSDCGKEKPLDDFVKDKRYHDGHRKRCKQCENLRRRKTPVLPQPRDGRKYCVKCLKEKPLDEFNFRNVKGEKKPFSYCKECEREYNRNKYLHVCQKCGKSYRSGKNKSTYCKECYSELLRDLETNPSKVIYMDWSGENNPMYGVRRFGKSNPNYNPNKTDEEREIERLVEGYSTWRTQVYERDNYTCQCCGDSRGGNLIAHHLDSWDWCKEKRLDVSNWITLCVTCHKRFHDIYGYGKNTKQQFYTFLSLVQKRFV